jgi:hypothetical protein
MGGVSRRIRRRELPTRVLPTSKWESLLPEAGDQPPASPVNVIERKTAPLPQASHLLLDPQTRTLTRRREHSIELEGSTGHSARAC